MWIISPAHLVFVVNNLNFRESASLRRLILLRESDLNIYIQEGTGPSPAARNPNFVVEYIVMLTNCDRNAKYFLKQPDDNILNIEKKHLVRLLRIIIERL